MSDFKFEAWPTEFLSINQHFGANPQNYAQFGLPGHEGIDVMAPSGSKIFAVADGFVSQVRTNPNGHNYGIHVRIDHADDYQTIYAHLQEAQVRVGEQVSAGQQIGLADNTGNSFGSHLHLTLKRKNQSQGNWPYNIFDPTPYLLPLMGFQRPAGPYIDGWAYTDGIVIVDDLAQANSGGINLRKTASISGELIDLIPGGSIMLVNGTPRNGYTPVKVPTASVSAIEPDPIVSEPPPTHQDNTIDGWAWTNYLNLIGNNQGVVGQYGINLRAAPKRGADNIGLVKGNSTILITGSPKGSYIPVEVRRRDFSGPINVPDEVVDSGPAPTPTPQPVVDDNSVLGWAYTQNLTINGNEAISGRYGTNLRSKPSRTGVRMGLFWEGGRGKVAGLPQGNYTPLIVPKQFIRNMPSSLPTVDQPDPLPENEPPTSPNPIQDSTPGWAFTAAITHDGGFAIAGPYGINLRDAPRRDGTNVGFIPAGERMILTGQAHGEYTPVRVDDDVIQAPYDPTTQPVAGGGDDEDAQPTPPPSQEPPILGSAQIGLHASADPTITQAEVDEFKDMRPGMIKVLSFHNPQGVQQLVNNHPNAQWVVRAFLDFRSGNGTRNISPTQFVNDTINDVKRTLNVIGSGKDVVVELHNEPNLTPEGLSGAWRDGNTFADWWLDVLERYRKAIPGMRFIYPGLSPGSAVSGIKQDHIQFIEASRRAVEAADGLATHIYWSNVYPMDWALNVLDDYISRFRYKPIWITEASNNKSGTAVHKKAQEYLTFWKELQKRPTVRGVTYFVASASDPAFKEEIWVGRGIGNLIGRR